VRAASAGDIFETFGGAVFGVEAKRSTEGFPYVFEEDVRMISHMPPAPSANEASMSSGMWNSDKRVDRFASLPRFAIPQYNSDTRRVLHR
jgi:hypothetical protein